MKTIKSKICAILQKVLAWLIAYLHPKNLRRSKENRLRWRRILIRIQTNWMRSAAKSSDFEHSSSKQSESDKQR